MSIKDIQSYDNMISELDQDSKNYVLLYRKGSESSDCSYDNISKVVENGSSVNILAADVSCVRDIHLKYNVNSVPTLLVFQGKKFEKTVKGCNDDGYYKSLFDSALFTAKNHEGKEQQKRVTVYSTPTCSWCTTLKNHLKNHGIRYNEIDVSKDMNAAKTMQNKSGQQGVPQTDINGQMIVGFDKQKINNLLNIN